MCDVDRENFSDLFPSVEDAIHNCDFIAFDTEFTTLVAAEEDRSSLFDDMETRYRKVRNSVSKAAIIQLGLSAFKRHPQDCGVYEAKTFNFYLCPQSLGVVDTRFTFQASSLQFLVRYQFDFNRFIYTGISYMNEEQEQKLMNHLELNKMFSGLERSVDEDALQEICSQVAEWMVRSEDEIEMKLEKTDLSDIPPYIVKRELQSRFKNIMVANRKYELLISKTIEVADSSVDDTTTVEEKIQTNQEVIENMLGFTRVFRIMKEAKKPLVGHNMLMDLLLMYDKFHRPLPTNYSEFKREIHAMFPVIFDTKHITSSNRRSLEHTGLLQKTALEPVYKKLHSREGREVVIHQPNIQHVQGFQKYSIEESNLPHEAGWDSYMCGYVFLRLAHILTFQNIRSADVIPCPFHRYLNSMSSYANNINLIRGYLNHINLAGPDPVTQRPDMLYLTHRKLWQTLDIEQVAKLMSRYGSVDVKPLGKSRALIAAGNFYCAKDILKGFKKDKVYYVTKYRLWKHSPIAQGLLWSGLLLSGGLCAWALLSSNKKQ